MTAENQPPTLQELNETLNRLTFALAASERRHASMVRWVRWGALALFAAIALSASVNLDRFNTAFGTPGNAVEPCSTLDCQLQPVSRFFGMMNELMGGMMQSRDVEAYMYGRYPDYRKKVETIKARQEIYKSGAGQELDVKQCAELPDSGCPAGDEECLQAAKEICADFAWIMGAMQERFPALAGQTIVDMALLVRRLREDSDEIRKLAKRMNIASPGGPVGLVALELSKMNRALDAVPAMANEMNVMNRQMSVMSHSVGSTMGRMGSMMPW